MDTRFVVDSLTTRVKELTIKAEHFPDERFLTLLTEVLINLKPGTVLVCTGETSEGQKGLMFRNEQRILNEPHS